MATWSDEELYGLEDFNFGISHGWTPIHKGIVSRRFETQHLIAEAIASTAGPTSRISRTTIEFEIDQILPEMLAAQNLMEETGWPSRKNNPKQYAIWNKARTAQAKIFKGLVTQLQQESPEFSVVLEGVGGWLAARGRKDPQLWRSPLIIPIEMFGKVFPVWVEIIKIHKRPTELDKSNLYTAPQASSAAQ